ncbi:hypothetical protein BGX27_005193 [Mortierella sp. AM989]|nr:hypothetical protein BGX27_005193 [Mortierella sp. AM989]
MITSSRRIHNAPSAHPNRNYSQNDFGTMLLEPTSTDSLPKGSTMEIIDNTMETLEFSSEATDVNMEDSNVGLMPILDYCQLEPIAIQSHSDAQTNPPGEWRQPGPPQQADVSHLIGNFMTLCV